jgi:hypothetical protein
MTSEGRDLLDAGKADEALALARAQLAQALNDCAAARQYTSPL